jgi:hypothetical protein
MSSSQRVGSLLGADDLEVLVDEDVVRPVDRNDVDVVCGTWPTTLGTLGLPRSNGMTLAGCAALAVPDAPPEDAFTIW